MSGRKLEKRFENVKNVNLKEGKYLKDERPFFIRDGGGGHYSIPFSFRRIKINERIREIDPSNGTRSLRSNNFRVGWLLNDRLIRCAFVCFSENYGHFSLNYKF